ncbi:MAG: hypothetical protein V3V16_10955 [Melioribacteraceae bacterium]
MKKICFKKLVFFVLSFSVLISCSTNTVQSKVKDDGIQQSDSNFANVISVQVSGSEKSYSFSVKLKSPDEGCKQYANWWEVISESGELIYRRILGHSHVNEQPFIRSGGSVNISANQTVIVRGHMNNTGYGTKAMKGSVSSGFAEITLDKDFAIELEQKEPLPQNCAF